MATDTTTRVEVFLPEPLRAFAEEQRRSGGYASIGEYVEAVLREGLLREERKRQAQERLETLLLEGLESGPATEMTDADWDEMRRRYDERHGSTETS